MSTEQTKPAAPPPQHATQSQADGGLASPVEAPASPGTSRQPGRRWPWQRSLQVRIVATYGLLFVVVILLLIARIGMLFYNTYFEAREHDLELAAFLAANSLEDPLSGFGEEFAEFQRWESEGGEREHSDDDHESDHESDHGDEQEREQSGAPTILIAEQRAPSIQSSPALPRLEQVARRYAADSNARVTILDPNGHALVDSHVPVDQVPGQADRIEVAAALSGEEKHEVRSDELTGESTIYAAAPIIQGTTILGVVRLSQSVREAMSGFRQQVWNLVLASLLAIVIAVGVGIWMGRRLVRPVRALEAAAIAASAGDLDQQVTIVNDDELGALGRAFNHMVRQLQETMERQRIFVANASHELRTPLTNIKLRTEALCMLDQDDPALTRRYMTEIDSEADRLVRLANELLDLSLLDVNQQTAPAESIQVRPILMEVVDMMALRAGRADVQLKSDLAAELPPVRVRSDHLEAVLINLVDNGMKYTPAGGRVTIQAVATETTLQITIADTGPGIPAEDLPHIFDRFYRVDKVRSRRYGQEDGSVGSGAGLGLAIVKQLVEQNGGRIQVNSTPGEGTRFVLYIPLGI